MLSLRFIQPWNGYDRGRLVQDFPHPGLAEDLVRMGIAKIVVEPKSKKAAAPKAASPPSRKD
jgi:hypothetical protein